VLSKKVSKFPITFTLDISPDSVPYPISGVLQDRRQSESKSVFKVLPLLHCVPTIITSSFFVGFERMSSDWKVKLTTSLVLQVFGDDNALDCQKCSFPRWFQSVSTDLQQLD
jgi:hypothetical protein